jgi:DNA-binding CsgD family transcriptional regulator
MTKSDVSKTEIGEGPAALSKVSLVQFVFHAGGRRYCILPKRTWAKTPHLGERAGTIRVSGETCVIFEVESFSRESQSLRRLTGREHQIASLIAEGRCDKAIARELGISDNTVREHLRRIFHKLGIGKRTSLVALFVSNATTINSAMPIETSPGGL